MSAPMRSRRFRSSATVQAIMSRWPVGGLWAGRPIFSAVGPRGLTPSGGALNNAPVRRLAASVLVFCLLAPASADAARQTPLARKLTRALAVPHVSPAHTGAVAIDLTTGKPVYARNFRLPLIPASNEKLP